MQFYAIHICQIMILRFYTVYNMHEMIKISGQTRENRKYYRKGSNNFDVDSTVYRCFSDYMPVDHESFQITVVGTRNIQKLIRCKQLIVDPLYLCPFVCLTPMYV